MDVIYSASVTAPVNIATMKYWGKRDVSLNLPTNNSISVTLSQDDLRTVTTAAASARFENDQLWLNGHEENIENSKRMTTLFRELRALRAKLEQDKKQAGEKYVIPLSGFPLHIVSENNFPTAAGLASSAAGFAAFVSAIAKLYELPQSPEELSILARQGSGSACRSLFGGFVAWEMGIKEDGSDSKAVEIAPMEHWPEMQACILVVSADKKDTPSTSGMQLTVGTSELFKYRVENVCPQRYEDMRDSILNKDFEKFSQLSMADSNQFHACCMDTTPPIFYMNDTSRACIRVVEQINQVAGKTVACYTFDAGPNAVVYYLKENENLVLGALKCALPNAQGWDNRPNVQEFSTQEFDQRWFHALASGVDKVICTKVGKGPSETSISLIDKNGLPIYQV